MKIKILFLSGTLLVGINAMECLKNIRSKFHCITTTSDYASPVIKLFDEIYLVNKTSKNYKNFEKKILKILKKEKIKIIIPCRDDDVCFLGKFKENYPEYKNIIPVGSYALTKIFINKSLSYNFCRSFKTPLPYAPSCSLDDKNELKKFINKYSFPLILKPKESFASQNVFVILNNKFFKYFKKNSKFLIQQFIGSLEKINKVKKNIINGYIPLFTSFEVEKISIQGMIDREGTVKNIIVTKNIMINGVSKYIYKLNNKKIYSIGLNWFKSISKKGWVGPLNIQCAKNHLNQIIIYEFNGRLTGATAARSTLGINEVLNLLCAFGGLKYKNISTKDLHDVVEKIYTHVSTSNKLKIKLKKNKHIFIKKNN